jgi:hypothetical protein
MYKTFMAAEPKTGPFDPSWDKQWADLMKLPIMIKLQKIANSLKKSRHRINPYKDNLITVPETDYLVKELHEWVSERYLAKVTDHRNKFKILGSKIVNWQQLRIDHLKKHDYLSRKKDALPNQIVPVLTNEKLKPILEADKFWNFLVKFLNELLEWKPLPKKNTKPRRVIRGGLLGVATR